MKWLTRIILRLSTRNQLKRRQTALLLRKADLYARRRVPAVEAELAEIDDKLTELMRERMRRGT